MAANDFGNATLTQYDSRGRRTREDRVLTVSGTGDGAHLGMSAGAPASPLAWRAFPTTSTHAVDLARVTRESTPPLGDPAQGGGDGLITVRYDYDASGRLAALTDDNGNRTEWQYDAQGRKIAETKGLYVVPASAGHNTADVLTTPTTIHWTYNATTGRLATMTREDGSVLTYTYDSRDAGRLISVSVTSGESVVPALVGTTAQTFTYDGPGRRIASTDNNEPATTADNADCAWRYDSLGRSIEESQQLGATGTLAVVSYKYTANDRAALVYPNGRTVDQTYHYPGGPLRTILDDGAPTAIAQYDYLGGRTLVRAMQNGVHLDLRDGQGAAYFDASGRPTKWLHLRYPVNPVNPVLIGFEYAYDANGNKLYQKSVHDPLDSQRYAYDSADRLTACVRGPFGALPEGFCGPSTGTWAGMDQYEGWNLDGLGNWSEYTTRKAGLTTATATTTVETRTDDTFNAYADIVGQASSLSPTHTPQTHDPNGNLTNDGKKVLKWDAMNRLREVWTTTGTLVAKYTYDTIGRRLQKTVQPGFPGESGVFRFADWRILEDCTTTAPPVPKRQYTYGNYLDEVLTMDTDLTTNGLCTDTADRRLFYHQNNLFSVYALTDAAGNVVEGYEYDPYGKHTLILDGNDTDSIVNFDWTEPRYAAEQLSAVSPSGNTRAFTGKPYDRESSFHWFNLRYCSGTVGTFLSRDPIGISGGINLYRAYFVPSGTDPLGRDPNSVPVVPLPLPYPSQDRNGQIPPRPNYPPYSPPPPPPPPDIEGLSPECWQKQCGESPHLAAVQLGLLRSAAQRIDGQPMPPMFTSPFPWGSCQDSAAKIIGYMDTVSLKPQKCWEYKIVTGVDNVFYSHSFVAMRKYVAGMSYIDPGNMNSPVYDGWPFGGRITLHTEYKFSEGTISSYWDKYMVPAGYMIPGEADPSGW